MADIIARGMAANAQGSGGGSVDLSDYYTKAEVNTQLNTKVNKVTGKELSTNDYTNAEKSKLASLRIYRDGYYFYTLDAFKEKIDADMPEGVRMVFASQFVINESGIIGSAIIFRALDTVTTLNCFIVDKTNRTLYTIFRYNTGEWSDLKSCAAADDVYTKSEVNNKINAALQAFAEQNGLTYTAPAQTQSVESINAEPTSDKTLETEETDDDI